jgi:PAS domain S-box-containing protein
VNVSSPLVQIALLGEAVDGAPVAIFVADENGRYAAVNRHACEVLGYTREELLALRVSDVAVGADVQGHYTRFVAQRFDAGTIELRCKDGSTLPFDYRAGETQIAGMTYYVSVGCSAAA